MNDGAAKKPDRGEANAPRLAVAPMMDWTDRHCRVLHRLLAPDTHLFSEMVAAGAIVHGDPARFLDFDPMEKPLSLQLGGSDPDRLARAVEIANAWDYDAIDLNCGCPSPRVREGGFGVFLMTEPERAAACVAAMASASDKPITVKHRLGVDDEEGVDFAARFVEKTARAGAVRFTVHARKAWLNGLSPKENREIPPLRYDWARALAAKFPELPFALNGGLATPTDAAREIEGFHGVMIGRAAYKTPGSLGAFERAIHGRSLGLSANAALAEYARYAARMTERGFRLDRLVKPALGLFQGEAGARRYRRILSEEAKCAGPELFARAWPALSIEATRS